MKPLRYLRFQSKNVQKNVQLNKLASTFSIDKLIGYKEIPCAGKADNNMENNNVNAHDLFSLFTANIIKANTFFVR